MDLGDISATDNRMTIGDLSSLWADVSLNCTTAHVHVIYIALPFSLPMHTPIHIQYSWDTAFHDMFDTVGITVDASEPVNVVTPSFFQDLHEIFSSQSST